MTMSVIADLFAKDPLLLTKEDRTEIIAFYRENRDKYVAVAKQEKQPKAHKATKGAGDLSELGDLELDL
jgi:hypothetical protein